MIISFIIGGLGNQFFQYAAARQIAHTRQVPLKLETRGYRYPKYAAHPYCLDKFRIEAEPVTLFDYGSLAPRALLRPVLFRENANGFNDNLSKIQDGAILVGYWQDPRYFSGVADLLREELTLRESPSAETSRVLEEILATESVSVHVRRTDYVKKPQNVVLFEECSLDYYRDAMTLVSERCAQPHFYIFSDDPDWTKANLQTSDFPMTFVSHNDVRSAHEDLILMRQCRHNIIANSTFSWWGAWLNANPRKIVVTPRRWFKHSRGNENDLLPAEWIRL